MNIEDEQNEDRYIIETPKLEVVPVSRYEPIKRWIPSLIILPLALYFTFTRGQYGIIDNADLVIHEAGHFVFSFFGKYIYTLGGALMQILLPTCILWYFLSNYYRTGMQFTLLWLGQNFVNISVYAADARAQVLPLLGGNSVYHDWHYLLGEINMLEYDQEAGYIIFGIGILVFLTALFLPLIIRD
jgi:hypothetical protein